MAIGHLAPASQLLREVWRSHGTTENSWFTGFRHACSAVDDPDRRRDSDFCPLLGSRTNGYFCTTALSSLPIGLPEGWRSWQWAWITPAGEATQAVTTTRQQGAVSRMRKLRLRRRALSAHARAEFRTADGVGRRLYEFLVFGTAKWTLSLMRCTSYGIRAAPTRCSRVPAGHCLAQMQTGDSLC